MERADANKAWTSQHEPLTTIRENGESNQNDDYGRVNGSGNRDDPGGKKTVIRQQTEGSMSSLSNAEVLSTKRKASSQKDPPSKAGSIGPDTVPGGRRSRLLSSSALQATIPTRRYNGTGIGGRNISFAGSMTSFIPSTWLKGNAVEVPPSAGDALDDAKKTNGEDDISFNFCETIRGFDVSPEEENGDTVNDDGSSDDDGVVSDEDDNNDNGGFNEGSSDHAEARKITARKQRNDNALGTTAKTSAHDDTLLPPTPVNIALMRRHRLSDSDIRSRRFSTSSSVKSLPTKLKPPSPKPQQRSGRRKREAKITGDAHILFSSHFVRGDTSIKELHHTLERATGACKKVLFTLMPSSVPTSESKQKHRGDLRRQTRGEKSGKKMSPSTPTPFKFDAISSLCDLELERNTTNCEPQLLLNDLSFSGPTAKAHIKAAAKVEVRDLKNRLCGCRIYCPVLSLSADGRQGSLAPLVQLQSMYPLGGGGSNDVVRSSAMSSSPASSVTGSERTGEGTDRAVDSERTDAPSSTKQQVDPMEQPIRLLVELYVALVLFQARKIGTIVPLMHGAKIDSRGYVPLDYLNTISRVPVEAHSPSVARAEAILVSLGMQGAHEEGGVWRGLQSGVPGVRSMIDFMFAFRGVHLDHWGSGITRDLTVGRQLAAFVSFYGHESDVGEARTKETLRITDSIPVAVDAANTAKLSDEFEVSVSHRNEWIENRIEADEEEEGKMAKLRSLSLSVVSIGKSNLIKAALLQEPDTRSGQNVGDKNQDLGSSGLAVGGSKHNEAALPPAIKPPPSVSRRRSAFLTHPKMLHAQNRSRSHFAGLKRRLSVSTLASKRTIPQGRENEMSPDEFGRRQQLQRRFRYGGRLFTLRSEDDVEAYVARFDRVFYLFGPGNGGSTADADGRQLHVLLNALVPRLDPGQAASNSWLVVFDGIPFHENRGDIAAIVRYMVIRFPNVSALAMVSDTEIQKVIAQSKKKPYNFISAVFGYEEGQRGFAMLRKRPTLNAQMAIQTRRLTQTAKLLFQRLPKCNEISHRSSMRGMVVFGGGENVVEAVRVGIANGFPVLVVPTRVTVDLSRESYWDDNEAYTLPTIRESSKERMDSIGDAHVSSGGRSSSSVDPGVSATNSVANATDEQRLDSNKTGWDLAVKRLIYDYGVQPWVWHYENMIGNICNNAMYQAHWLGQPETSSSP